MRINDGAPLCSAIPGMAQLPQRLCFQCLCVMSPVFHNRVGLSEYHAMLLQG